MLVISGNSAISAALVAHDLNVIPVDPVETPGWADRVAAAHLLVLDLGDADQAVDALAKLRNRAVDTPALVVAESVTDSPRLVSLRLADQNVKTLSWPLTPERLVRAVERAMSTGGSDEEGTVPSPAAGDRNEQVPTPGPVVPPPAAAPADRSGIQWPTFDKDSFAESAKLDWRTAFTDGLEPPQRETWPAPRSETPPVAPPPVVVPPAAQRSYAPPPVASTQQRPMPPINTQAANAQPSIVPPAPSAPQPPAAPPASAAQRPPIVIDTEDYYDLPPVPSSENRKHRLAPWARPRPGATGRFEEIGANVRPAPAPTNPYAAPPAQNYPPQNYAPQNYAPPPTAAAAPPAALPQSPAAPPALPAAPQHGYQQPAYADPRQERAAARAAEKARVAAEKMQAKAWAQAERDAAKARAAAEKAAARGLSVEAPQVQPIVPVVLTRPDEVEGVRLIPPAPLSKADIKAAERAAAEAERAARAAAEAAARAEIEAAKAAKARAEAEAKEAARIAIETERANRARAEAEAKAAERAAVEAAKAEKARAEAQAKAAVEAARAAEADQKNRARAEAEAAKAAERAAAIAAKAAAEKAAADARAAIEAEKAIQKARIEAARIAEAQARAAEKAAKLQAEADARLAAEQARAAERAAAEAAREEARIRAITDREAQAQARIDSRLAAEAAKAARALAEQEAAEAAIKAKEDAERAREEARLAAEAARVQTIAKVEEVAQHTKIRAEADRIVGEAVRKAEEDFTARALANRPVYYGPELEPPGIGYVHQVMQMTESLASPDEIAEELAFVAMEHLVCDAVAVMIPDGDCWVTASGIGVVRNDLRYRLSEEHWFIRHVLGQDEIVLIEDTEALRDELSGVPLSGWRYLVGIPLADANSIVVGARSEELFDAEAVAEFAASLTEFVSDLAESLLKRDVARQIHERGGR